MAYKILIDAGHGGSDSGAAYNGRLEKDDVLRLALAVGNILSQRGIDVVYSRTDDTYDSPYEKAVKGNQADADLFLSIHRNASPQPDSAQGVETLVYSDTGLPAQLARNINSELEKAGFASRGVVERPNLAVLRRTKMPAALVEVGFIDSDNDNRIFDQNFEAIAQAIADGVLETVHGPEDEVDDPVPPTAPVRPMKLYRVQVGAYRSSLYASQLLRQLLAEGFPAFIVYGNGVYRVQVGAFRNMDNAVRMERRLQQAGYNTFLTT